jgi:uncharacterized protein (TIGR02444 family)
MTAPVSSTPAGAEGPHWPWVLALYARPGVGPACLRLQDHCGLDVNLLLVMLHAVVAECRYPPPGGLAAADAAVAPLRAEVVQPLRAVRRHLKLSNYGPMNETVRNRVKACELAAEQMEQAVLAGLMACWPRIEAAQPPGVATLSALIRDLLRETAVMRTAALAPEDEAALQCIATAATGA